MEGKTININAPIYNYGGTVNGDIVNPVYFQGAGNKNKQERVMEALKQIIKGLIDKGKSAKDLLAPYVAALDLGFVNKMKVNEFNDAFGCSIAPSSFTEWTREDAYQEKDLKCYKSQFESM